MKVNMGLSSLQRALAPIFVRHLEYRKNAILVSKAEVCRLLFARCYFVIGAARFLLLGVLLVFRTIGFAGVSAHLGCIDGQLPVLLCTEVVCWIGEVS
jgi:hypothetical protein